MACQRATRSDPTRRSSAGTRAIWSTTSAIRYPASRPVIRPALRIMPVWSEMAGVLRHHSHNTPAAPAHTASSRGTAGERRGRMRRIV